MGRALAEIDLDRHRVDVTLRRLQDSLAMRGIVAPERYMALAKVRDALNGLRYGQVTVVVQDGVVVQVERTEKVRVRSSTGLRAS